MVMNQEIENPYVIALGIGGFHGRIQGCVYELPAQTNREDNSDIYVFMFL